MDPQLAAELRKLRNTVNGFGKLLQDHYKPALETVRTDVAALQRTNSAAPPTGGGLLQSIESIPGARMPQWYVAEKSFALNDTAQQFASVEITPEGPFIVTQVAAFFRATGTVQGDPTGRLLPLSAFRAFAIGGDGSNAVGTIFTSMTLIPEFSIRYEVEGSGRFLNNVNMPAHMADALDHPKYTGCLGWVDGSNRLKTFFTPEIAVPVAGKCIAIFVGYQILNPIKLGDVLAGRYAA